MREPPTIAVSAGEPAGIGPELIALLDLHHRERPFAARLVVVGDREVAHGARGADRPRAAVRRLRCGVLRAAPMARIEVWHQPVAAPVTPGQPDPANAHSVVALLQRASDACATGAFSALVTAPVRRACSWTPAFPSPGTPNSSRSALDRRTSSCCWSAARRTRRFVSLSSRRISPLKDVPAALTRDRRRRDARASSSPSSARSSRSPRRGSPSADSIRTPARAAIWAARRSTSSHRRSPPLREAGHDVTGPFPADTIFVPEIARRFDAIVAMYHDQGLPVLKAASFGRGVNVTLGLPFIRTSVDHGTALDLAVDAAKARGADPGSLIAAVDLAIELAARAETH